MYDTKDNLLWYHSQFDLHLLMKVLSSETEDPASLKDIFYPMANVDISGETGCWELNDLPSCP